MDQIYIEAGRRIQVLRKELGISREELAEYVNLSPKFIYEIESGKKGFSALTLANFSKSLDVSTDFILFGKRKEITEEEMAHIINLINSLKELLR